MHIAQHPGVHPRKGGHEGPPLPKNFYDGNLVFYVINKSVTSLSGRIVSMKLRLILLVLSFLSFLSAAAGGYLYYTSLQEAAFHEAERQALNRLVAIKRNLSAFLSENVKPVRVLAGMKEIRQFLVRPDAAALAQANAMLDHFQKTLGVEVCYLMDRRGNTVASSNRRAPDSFVGFNFAFRPYFEQAVSGIPATYLAIGTAFKRRGAYYSHPVSGKRAHLWAWWLSRPPSTTSKKNWARMVTKLSW